jgi:hypothetical protein
VDWLIPVVLAVAGAVVLLLILLGIARLLEKRRAQQVLARFAGQEVLGLTSNALFFGRESLGMAQVRGNGGLVLTPEQLFFEMWAPRRQVAIPVGSIGAITTPKSHLGKSRFRPLLKVEYKNEAGNADSCAWLVRNLETWRAALERLVQLRAEARDRAEG